MITKAIINTRGLIIPGEDLLGRLGYSKHFNSYIKKDNYGRFHIYYLGDELDVHYDVNVTKDTHMALPSDYILPKEVRRIKRIVNKFRKRQTVVIKKSKSSALPKVCQKCRIVHEDNKCVAKEAKPKRQKIKFESDIEKMRSAYIALEKESSELKYVPSLMKMQIKWYKKKIKNYVPAKINKNRKSKS